MFNTIFPKIHKEGYKFLAISIIATFVVLLFSKLIGFFLFLSRSSPVRGIGQPAWRLFARGEGRRARQPGSRLQRTQKGPEPTRLWALESQRAHKQ